MAKVTATLPDAFTEKLTALGNRTDDVCEKMLEAGGKIALQAVRSNLSAVIGSGTKYPSKSTGELQNALGMSPVKLDKNGNYDIKIGFSEPHSGGVSNAMIASIIEYGKTGQKAKPFMKPAKRSCKSDVEAAMIRIFDEMTGNI